MTKREPLVKGAGSHTTPTGEGEPDALQPAPPGVPFPIVGIGASAGGLDAFTQLLAHLPADCGMAFVLIQHLDPTHRSFLSEALSRATAMPVSQAEDGTRVEPNHVYVIPPNADLSILDGALTLVPRPEDMRRLHLPIDSFFRALAGQLRSRSIGVVLTGTASDGTEGLRAIKAEGGITFAQDPGTAKFGGMPRSAVDAGVVDNHLPIPELARELVRLSHHAYLGGDEAQPTIGEEGALGGIMGVVKAIVGVDFSEYKGPTFARRLARRMALRRVDDRTQYLALLRGDPEEVRALYEDTLIHVTSFFRDPEAFDALSADVFPQIVRHKAEGAPIRVWVAGCSTGEEVYSLVIALLEFLGEAGDRSPHPVQIFGSDVSEKAIEKARAGLFPDGAMLGMNDERRRRYFTKVDGGYRINKGVRELCVFVRHDLARDPPFSKLDLVSCRNVLIYFDQALQKRVLPTLHYSLNQPGFLLLGRTESVSGFGQLFSPLDRTHKIFARSSAPSALRFAPRREVHPAGAPAVARARTDHPRRPLDLGKHLDRLLLARYAPAGVLINEKLEILQYRGETGAYLQPAPGEPQNNLVKMARSGLLARLRATIARAKDRRAPARAAGVEIDQEGFTRTCDLVVVPFTGPAEVKEPLFVVLFEEARRGRGKAVSAPVSSRKRATSRRRAPRLEHELTATKEYLRSVIEEHDQTNDELGSANEELVSGNEELQSLNEELETAKEELQSTNEELTTVNDELHSRNQETSQINSDLVNLLTTVDVPILILDTHRRIRRFTPQARHILNVLPSDVGRLLDDIKPNIDVPDLDRQVAEVIETIVAKEAEVEDRDGRWYRMQIRPFKTMENKIDGAIVSLFDIDVLKHHVSEARRAKEQAERSDRAKDQFLATLSHELRTPLAATLMHAQMLRRGGLDSVKVERACESIERLTRTQVQLIDDLLDVSRIVTGKLNMELAVVHLGAVVEAAVEGVAASAQAKSVEIKLFVDDSLGPVSGDRVRLEQVVSNLLTNAIKFTPSGGEVTIVLETVAGQACLRVSDTGIGIEPAFLPRIFNRFTQEDSSSTRVHGGLGLGLAIVHHLVDAHGGTVRAESPGTGKGAIFCVTLPFMPTEKQPFAAGDAPAPHTDGHDDGAAGSGGLSELRILVVDDDASTCEALTEVLAQTGATVMTAGSAAEGMTIFQQFHPDVLLCDIAMPFEDGYAFIRKIRILGAARGGDTPALALTALAGPEDRLRALAAGFQVHMAKPVDVDRLAAAVMELARTGNQALPAERSSAGPLTN